MAEFTLEDKDGNIHTYQTTPHPALEDGPHTGGLRLVAYVVEAGGRPLARLVESNIAELIGDLQDELADHDGALLEMETDRVVELLEGLDWDIVDSFDDFMKAMQEADPEWLFPELLRHTSRDGHPLSKSQNFNDAYTANYMELVQAAREVIRINGFFGSVVSRLKS